MSLIIASINSGSNGNCYYVGNETEAVLIDAGISSREILKRMKAIGLCSEKIKAIFISHEHTDHVKGLPGIAAKLQLPVFISMPTLSKCPFFLNNDQVVPFRGFAEIEVGGLLIRSIPKSHDACDPYSFTVSSQNVTAGVFTDIGFACGNVKYHFARCHAAFLEANYDEQMLWTGKYPPHLKKRISGPQGHLSNQQALQLFLEQRPDCMSHLILSHLSAENNHPQKAMDLFAAVAAPTKVQIASRYGPSEVVKVSVHGGFSINATQHALQELPFAS